MLSVAFLLDDSNVHDVDLSEPWLGNPAVGGTEYSFVSLAHELATRGIADVTLLHRRAGNRFPASVKVVRIEGYPQGLRWSLEQMGQIDSLIVRGHDSLLESKVVEMIPGRTPVIAWTHNHLRSATLSYLARREEVKRVVYVGREQCALAGGAACHFKATYIVPGYYPAAHHNGPKKQRAVYLGSLIPQKGFHRLARLWPRIRRACPTAELDVIGSSRINLPAGAQGSMGIATPAYEKLIMRYLKGDPAAQGVVFRGKMGVEKYDVVARAAIGLPNPTGFTECCPASVVEMSECGTAVVALRQWGMCDTVVDQVTGYLCRDDHDYVERVVSLFADPDRTRAMGVAGRRFARETFSYSVVCEQWSRLLQDMGLSARPSYSIPPLSGRYPFVRLRTMNQRMHSARLHAVVSFADRVRGVFLKRY